jgi:hypothetical protein
VFRPLAQLSAQTQVTDTLSLAGQYFFDWDSYRFPEGGTYLGFADAALNGPQQQFAGPPFGVVKNAGIGSTPKKTGDFGVHARWSPAALDGTVGFYYRNFTDKLPSLYLNAIPGAATYQQFYAENIDLFGISLSKQIAGVSVGAEVSYRHNMPLLSQSFGAVTTVAPLAGAVFPKGAPQLIDNSYAARGDTMHIVLNAVGIVPKTPVFDFLSYSAELAYGRWTKVTANQQMFFGEGFICNGTTKNNATGRPYDKWDGCATKNALSFGLNLSPTWYQVYPGVDLTMPVAYGIGLKGNAPTGQGGNQGSGTYSLGISADVYQKYKFTLAYVDFIGHAKELPSPLIPGQTAVVAVNGSGTFLRDRGSLGFTFKTTF